MSNYRLLLDNARRRIVLHSLESYAGHRAKAAAALGLRRSTLGALIVRLGLGAEVARRWPPRSGPTARKN